MENELIEQPVHLDLFAKGYDNFGQSPLLFYGADANKTTATILESGLPPNFIKDGDIVTRLNVIEGYLQSNNYVAGSAGWRIDGEGVIDAFEGNFRGDITGASGAFSGTVTVGFDEINAGTNDKELNIGVGNVKLDGPNKRIIINDGENDRVLIGYLENGF
jgi:hypothetical protein